MRIRGLPQALSLAALTVGTLEVTGAATFAETVTATGQFLAADGSAGAPSYSFLSAPDCGMFYSVSRQGPTLVTRYAQPFLGDDNNLGTRALVSSLGFCSSLATDGTADLILDRDAADVLAQRRGTNAQAFRLYSAFTDASNYSRLAFTTGGGAFEIIGESAGTGTPLSIQIKAGSGCAFHFGGNGAVQWNVSPSGHLLAGADNAYDIGAPGSRVSIYYGIYGNFDGYVAAGQLRVTGIGGIYPGASSGVLVLTNATEDGFSRLCFGGTTSSFPALKRVSSYFQARLADDSGFTAIAATAFLDANTTQVVGTQGAPVADATGAGDVVAQLNTLLARLRAHGLIST